MRSSSAGGRVRLPVPGSKNIKDEPIERRFFRYDGPTEH
jgi:hypothetical protein